jgi:transcriptional regulator with XRE-family HTH domain
MKKVIGNNISNPLAPTDRVKIGASLKGYREIMRFTQDEITERTGLTRRQIIAIEKGTADYRVDTLLRYLNGIERFISFRSDIQR